MGQDPTGERLGQLPASTVAVTPADLDLSVVLPRYKEADNLEPPVRQIFTVTAAAGIRAEVIVVDDDSRDGTEAKCHALSAHYNL